MSFTLATTPRRVCRCGHDQDWHASYREHCTAPGCCCLSHSDPAPRS